MKPYRQVFERQGPEFDRGLGFFDAIYGFAITLLIANVDLPPAEAWQSPATLLDHGLDDQLLGFAISFIVIAVFWKRNTELLGGFTAIDGPVIAANLVTAALIVLLPFTTQSISDPQISELPLPVALYAANVALAIVSLSAMLEVGRARGLLADDVASAAARWAERVDVLAKIAVFAVSIPVAYLASADWGMFVWLSLLVVAPVTGRWSDRIAENAQRMSPGE